MYCHNCGNADRFVLSVELAAVVRSGGGAEVPQWTADLACRRCASTDVAGEPIEVLGRL